MNSVNIRIQNKYPEISFIHQFLYTNDELSERETKRIIPFTIESTALADGVQSIEHQPAKQRVANSIPV